VEARSVVAADGTWSRLGRLAGLPGNRALKKGLQYKFSPSDVPEDVGDDEWLWFYFGESYPGGYAWVFQRGHEVSIGVCGRGNMHKRLDAFCRDLGVNPGSRRELNAGMIPTGGVNERLHTGGLVTVGDAAGLVNPISDGGNHQALSSGRWAAEAVLEYLSGEPEDVSPLEGYEKRVFSSPFNHPHLLEGMEAIHRFPDKAWDFVTRVAYGKTTSEVSKARWLAEMLSHPGIWPHVGDMMRLSRAAKIYKRYGW
ncbi:MAG: NAD(P)/FAD-dependent oxidoreductase, partial [Thermoplasmata archaeon]|nr:NAD(P)/FAD-dependent oxidoreductase [Thermoplasmata archaeon]